MNKAIFLDRDGVINRKVPNKDFVKNPEELVYLPKVKDIVKKIKQKGYLVIIVSNQSGINRGIIKNEGLEKINDKLRNDLNVDGIYYCPHLPDENCNCRKPKIGLFERAVKDFNIDLKNSLFIGDNDFDIEAGKTVSCKTLSVNGNEGLMQIENILDNLKGGI